MSVHIIIDGYNLIRQSVHWAMLDLQDLQTGREALLDALSAYKRQKAHRITVVFDGADAPSYLDRKDKVRGIAVTFSGPGESADTVIKKMADRYGEQALVVSSDRDITQFARRRGAGTISSPDFERKIAQTGLLPVAEDTPEGWTPGTRKKGPRRKLPKRERRNRSKLEKL